MPINYRNYPPGWRTHTRPRILARAGHRCEHCGLPNYAVVESRSRQLLELPDSYLAARIIRAQATCRAIVVVLTIAHLDHNEWDHTVTDDRLAALCQKCHLAHDRADNEMRKKYGKHFKKNQFSIL